ncbi:MAG TPA: DUF2795 domain-containing protein [Nitrososphaera sp.]|nr:DUF2795 domain-containing protein [Nitrososphaera sp.]
MGESSTSKRENPDQIPQDDDTRGKTGRVISEQAGVEGQRKEVNVESYSKVAALGQILKGMDFPADKDKIIAFARQQTLEVDNKTAENKEDILLALQNLEERKYKNVSDISTALGFVY